MLEPLVVWFFGLVEPNSCRAAISVTNLLVEENGVLKQAGGGGGTAASMSLQVWRRVILIRRDDDGLREDSATTGL